jgi:uncharacterized membrane protein YgcG
MSQAILVLSPEDYLERFPIKAEEVPRVIGKPIFVSSNVVIKALKTNCIRMKDPRSALGKLHCMMDSASMEANKTAIVASKDPSEIKFPGSTTAETRATHIAQYNAKRANWESDENVKEACKIFLLSRFEPLYFQALSDSITKFKNVTVIELIDHITTKYPPKQEEMNAVEATLREQWYPTNHIENPFQTVKEGTDTLLLMKAINDKEWDKTFIRYVYTAISNSGQFDTACLKWSALPKKDRSTTKQCRAYFDKKYDTFEASQDSLSLAGVAYSVQRVQDLEQATHSGFISIQDKQEEQDAVNTRQEAVNASVLQMVAARSTTGDGIDDNATAFSALTASSAVKDRRIIDLELQLRCTNNPTPPPTGGGSAFPWRGGGGGGSSRGGSSHGGGRGGGRGGAGRGGRSGSNRGYRSRADGPENMTENSKYWNADTYCWTCGYDCSRNHDSSTCTHKAPGHQSAATGSNPMGGSIKDKEYPKWNCKSWEQQANNIEKKETDSATETIASSILKTSNNYKCNINTLETPRKIEFSTTTLVAIGANDQYNTHIRYKIENHNPNRHTVLPVRSMIKSRKWH